MELSAGVGCIVLREDPVEPVLLLRRAFGRFEGSWCFVAGTPRAGESPASAASRELYEETGIRATPELLFSSSEASPGTLIHVFVVRVPGSPSIRLDSEHSEWRWWSYSEAEAVLPLPAQRHALALAREA